MAEIRCRKCGKRVDGKADLCLFCGKKVSGGGHGNLTGGRKRGFPIGVLLTIILLSCLCCVLGAQLEPVRNAAADLLPRGAEGLTLPTDVSNPTATAADKRVVSTSTPTPPPTETPKATSTPEGTDVPLLPKGGGSASGGPFLILALGGTLLLFGGCMCLAFRRA